MSEFRTKYIEMVCRTYRRTLDGFTDNQLNRIEHCCRILMNFIDVERSIRK